LQVTENRFELWLAKRRFSRLIFVLASLLVWLLCDSSLAVVIVKAGHASREEFFATSLHSLVYSEHRDIPEIRDLLARHARLYPSYLDRFQADGLLGTRLAPNFLVVGSPPPVSGSELLGGVDKSFWFMTDEQGFPPVARLGHHYLLTKPANVFRVIMLGGSTVEGIGVNSPLESLPSKLQLLLEQASAQSSKQIEVINAGVSGYSSDREYLLLIADLLQYQPDLVIAYDGWNDAQLLPVTIAGIPDSRPYRTLLQQYNEDRVNTSYSPMGSFRLFATIAAGRSVKYLSHFSTFWLLQHSVQRITDRLHWNAGSAQQTQIFHRDPSVDAARFYIENRERMLFIAKQKKFRFASFLQPIMLIDGKSYTAAERKYAARFAPRMANDVVGREREVFYQAVRPLLEEFASKNEVSGASCVADISTTSFAGVSDTVYADSGHLLANGNELVAQRMLGELKRCELLP
jgi:hypothetical protein